MSGTYFSRLEGPAAAVKFLQLSPGSSSLTQFPHSTASNAVLFCQKAGKRTPYFLLHFLRKSSTLRVEASRCLLDKPGNDSNTGGTRDETTHEKTAVPSPGLVHGPGDGHHCTSCLSRFHRCERPLGGSHLQQAMKTAFCKAAAPPPWPPTAASPPPRQ